MSYGARSDPSTRMVEPAGRFILGVSRTVRIHTKKWLQNLSMDCCTEDRNICIIIPCVGESETIQFLDLSWNIFRRKGAGAIAEGLKVSSHIREEMCRGPSTLILNHVLGVGKFDLEFCVTF